LGRGMLVGFEYFCGQGLRDRLTRQQSINKNRSGSAGGMSI
jgi:hypothetical protein